MPPPIDINSSDAYVYNNVLIPLSKNICFIHPNYVTITNILLIIVIVYSILYKWQYSIFITIIFIRALLDCLDGSIARTCNTTSDIGALLDIFGDSLALLSVSISLVYLIYLKYGKNAFVYIFIGMLFICLNIICVSYTIINKKKLDGIYKLLHDNSLIINIIGGSLLWIYIHNCL